MDKKALFSIAEANYSAMLKSSTFISDPDYLRFPLLLPPFKAVFVTVNNKKIKEIEIHYENGRIQTVRPENV